MYSQKVQTAVYENCVSQQIHKKFEKSQRIHNVLTKSLKDLEHVVNIHKETCPLFAQPGQRLEHSGPSWPQTADA